MFNQSIYFLCRTFGDKSQPPVIPDNVVIPENSDSEQDEQSSVKEENDNLPVDSNNEETDVREIQDTNDSVTKESDVLECSNNIQELHLKNNISPENTGDSGNTDDVSNSPGKHLLSFKQQRWCNG